MYRWELGHPEKAVDRLRKLQSKAVRKVTGGYHGSRQELVEEISKVEPVQVKLWDMKVRAAARILEKGVQNDLISQAEDTRERIGGRSWQDYGLAWTAVKPPHYNACLEEILAAMGENGEREIPWNFDRNTHAPRAITELELGTKDTLKVVWDLRIRIELEEEGWTTCYTDDSGLEDKASGRSHERHTQASMRRKPDQNF